jgi:hypothetical protein
MDMTVSFETLVTAYKTAYFRGAHCLHLLKMDAIGSCTAKIVIFHSNVEMLNFLLYVIITSVLFVVHIRQL